MSTETHKKICHAPKYHTVKTVCGTDKQINQPTKLMVVIYTWSHTTSTFVLGDRELTYQVTKLVHGHSVGMYSSLILLIVLSDLF